MLLAFAAISFLCYQMKAEATHKRTALRRPYSFLGHSLHAGCEAASQKKEETRTTDRQQIKGNGKKETIEGRKKKQKERIWKEKDYKDMAEKNKD